MADFQAWNLGRMKNYSHEASITTPALETNHNAALEVSFLHNFPGAVVSSIAGGQIGGLICFLKTVCAMLGPRCISRWWRQASAMYFFVLVRLSVLGPKMQQLGCR